MSKLESLVPPLELCKLIPAGEFEDSALVWLNINYVTIPWKVVARNISNYKMERNKKKIPAPTLQEIMEELCELSPYAIKLCKSFGEWSIESCIAVEKGERLISADSSKNLATAALRLWLKLKGIEHE